MNNGIASFRDLNVYQKAYAISINIHKHSKSFPKDEQYGITNQLRRASRSICANIAEGFAKQRTSKAEFKRFLMIAVGSASEVLVWIDYCRDFEFIDERTHEIWKAEYEAISKMLNAFHSKV
ncbi:MAG: four helix bundle protein [Bdellovibrionales bacterium]